MDTERVAPLVGLLGCLAVVVTVALPYVAAPGWSAELGRYYAAGPVGAGAVLFFALIAAVAFLAGARGRTDATTAAGVALALGVVALLVAASWATAVSLDPLFGYPGSWIVEHRWYVVGTTAVVSVAAAAYARAALA